MKINPPRKPLLEMTEEDKEVIFSAVADILDMTYEQFEAFNSKEQYSSIRHLHQLRKEHQKMSKFQREQRYRVYKLKDLEQLPAKHKQRLQQIEQAVFAIRKGKPLDCVVVESDWPIYEATWQQVQAVANGTHIIRDPSLLISAVCNAVEPSPADHTLEDVARRVRSLSVHQNITTVEADAVRNAMDALRKDPQAGPVGLGSLIVLEDLLQRNGYEDLEKEELSTYDYYVMLCRDKGVDFVPELDFPSALRPLDPPTEEGVTSRVRSGRIYYSPEQDTLCTVVANFWEDGACYVAERYTDDISDSYFTVEQDRLREVLP